MTILSLSQIYLQQLIDNSVSEAEKTSVSDTNMEQESSAKNSLFGSITVLAASKQPANYTTPRVAAILRNNYKLALSLNAKSNQFKSYIPIPFIKNKVDVTFGAFANSYKIGAFTALVKGNGEWNKKRRRLKLLWNLLRIWTKNHWCWCNQCKLRLYGTCVRNS